MRSAMFATLAAAAALAHLPASAQGTGETIHVTINEVHYERVRQFEDWIADYRSEVEGLIEEGRLSDSESCAYSNWRVVAPTTALRRRAAEAEDFGFPIADPIVFMFVADPVVPDADASPLHYLTMALGEDAAQARMQALERLLTAPQRVLELEPLAPRDALGAEGLCD